MASGLDVWKKLTNWCSSYDMATGHDQPNCTTVGSRCSIPRSIDCSAWACQYEGYHSYAYVVRKYPFVAIVDYIPVGVMGVGFSRPMILIDKDKPFPAMDALLKEAAKSVGVQKEFRFDPEGNIHSPFGPIEKNYVSKVLDIIMPLYDAWSEFPNAKDIKTVKKLLRSREKVDALKIEERSKGLATQIDSRRQKIRELQSEIADIEKLQNKIYEEAADAMNYLEENGYKINLESPVGRIDGRFDYGTPFTIDDFVLDPYDQSVMRDETRIINVDTIDSYGDVSQYSIPNPNGDFY